MVVRASDQRVPEKIAQASVIIGIIRNQFSPQFQLLPYRAAVSENLEVGRSIISVSAVDLDAVSVQAVLVHQCVA